MMSVMLNIIVFRYAQDGGCSIHRNFLADNDDRDRSSPLQPLLLFVGFCWGFCISTPYNFSLFRHHF